LNHNLTYCTTCLGEGGQNKKVLRTQESLATTKSKSGSLNHNDLTPPQKPLDNPKCDYLITPEDEIVFVLKLDEQ